MLARLMKAATAPDSGMEIYAGACVGGSTVVNDALCWRPPAEVLAEWRSRYGLSDLDEAALAPHVDRVWNEIGAAPTDRAHLNRNARLLALGAKRLGWAAEPMARNVRGCANLGLCNLGCPSGAKQSALLTWVPRAERGGARIVPLARAERIEVEAGRVRAVEAVRLDAAGGTAIGRLRVEAPRVVVAAGVLETPGLLLRSGLGGPAAGRFLQFHSSVYVTARFEEPVFGFYGPTMAYAVTEFSNVYGRSGPGFMIESVAAAPTVTASSLPGFGAPHERAMQELPRLARAVVVLRDQTRGRVALGSDGRPCVSYDPVAVDRSRLREAVRQIASLYFEAGATEVYLPVNSLRPARSNADLARFDRHHFAPRSLSLLYAVHLFGGAVMGARREESVCDPNGALWGVRGLFASDASCFPSNTGVNPQVTIMANALRIAEAIA